MKIASIIVTCAALAAGLTFNSIANAQDSGGDRDRGIERFCSNDKAEDVAAREARMVDRATEGLKLTDAQKAAFKDLQDARIKARADAKTALCSSKPDLSKLEGKLAFHQAILEQRLAEMKATNPKLLAFYKSEYAPKCAKVDGISAQPGGAAYYAFKVRQHTTTNLTAEQIHQIGLKEVARIRADMETVS